MYRNRYYRAHNETGLHVYFDDISTCLQTDTSTHLQTEGILIGCLFGNGIHSEYMLALVSKIGNTTQIIVGSR